MFDFVSFRLIIHFVKRRGIERDQKRMFITIGVIWGGATHKLRILLFAKFNNYLSRSIESDESLESTSRID